MKKGKNKNFQEDPQKAIMGKAGRRQEEFYTQLERDSRKKRSTKTKKTQAVDIETTSTSTITWYGEDSSLFNIQPQTWTTWASGPATINGTTSRWFRAGDTVTISSNPTFSNRASAGYSWVDDIWAGVPDNNKIDMLISAKKLEKDIIYSQQQVNAAWEGYIQECPNAIPLYKLKYGKNP